MKAWLWVVVALLGLGLMIGSYTSRDRLDPSAPWARGVLVVGPIETVKRSPSGPLIRTRLRLLPGSETAEAMIKALGPSAPGGALTLQARLRPKLIRLPRADAKFDARWLRSGRLPNDSGGEVVAGASVARRDRLNIGGQTLTVVGVLRPDVALFADSYLLPDTPASDNLFPANDPDVHPAILAGRGVDPLGDPSARGEWRTLFPPDQFAWLTPMPRLSQGVYDSYLAGQAILLLGGSGALIGLYGWLAGRVRPRWLAAPLEEMSRRPGLLWSVHLVYFDLVILGSILIFGWPEVQTMLVSAVQAELGGKRGPLGLAGWAYRSGLIPLAAVVTLLVNFLLGSVVCITLPSLVLPGAGAVLAAFRAGLWGVLLAPAFAGNAAAMIPHTGTMLLEGEGYILATFFGLLVPIRMAQASLGDTVLRRFMDAARLNLQALALVALVLALAACYEATEIILMIG